MSKAENAERLAGELAPQWRRRRADRPLALPLSGPHLAVEPPEVARERDHGAHDIFGDPRLVAVGVGKREAGAELRAIDAIEASARSLHQAEPLAGCCQLF